jgi:hypothetical protein
VLDLTNADRVLNLSETLEEALQRTVDVGDRLSRATPV